MSDNIGHCPLCGGEKQLAAKLEGFVAGARRKRTMVEITQWKQVAA